MPLLDVSDILSDPDFADEFVVTRTTVTTVNGRSVKATETFPDIDGVVVSDSGDILDRLPDMRRVAGSILIYTDFTLTAGLGGIDADIVTWNTNQYTVTAVNDYSRYGAGFVCAKCEPLRLV